MDRSAKPPVWLVRAGGGNCCSYKLLVVRIGEVPRGEKMLFSGTDPESYITEYTLVYEEKMVGGEKSWWLRIVGRGWSVGYG